MPASDDIIFEQPVSERVRTMLRLEHLFAQLAHHREDASPWGLRASLGALIDILSLFSRNDLKTEIIRELGEKHQALLPLRDRPGVNSSLLTQTLDQLESAIRSIQSLSSQAISQTLKDSHFLLTVINRSTIPGGTSHIDLPGLHRWLQKPGDRNRRDMNQWLMDISAFESASALYLSMLRQSSGWQAAETVDGIYVHTSKDDKFHLIRIAVPADCDLYPEISAGRQRFSVRFLQQPSALESEAAVTGAIPFQLSLCSL